jgi:hypothetical protein
MEPSDAMCLPGTRGAPTSDDSGIGTTLWRDPTRRQGRLIELLARLPDRLSDGRGDSAVSAFPFLGRVSLFRGPRECGGLALPGCHRMIRTILDR